MSLKLKLTLQLDVLDVEQSSPSQSKHQSTANSTGKCEKQYSNIKIKWKQRRIILIYLSVCNCMGEKLKEITAETTDTLGK